jgi:hypothetical protein
MGTPEESDKVRPALRRVEAELARHLEEACEDYDRDNIAQESTDELLQLEEELLAAARAVDQAVKLRRKLNEPTKEPSNQSPPSAETPVAEPTTRVREFRTASGSEWRVWEVRPGAGGRVIRPQLYPADYAQGWLAFELLQGEGRKRLPKFSPEWSAASDQDLEALLERAVDVPKRKSALPGSADRGGLGG